MNSSLLKTEISGICDTISSMIFLLVCSGTSNVEIAMGPSTIHTYLQRIEQAVEWQCWHQRSN